MTIEELQPLYDQLLLDNAATNERLIAALASIESLTAEKSELNGKLLDAMEMRKSAENDLGVARSQVERFKKGFESQSRLHADAVAAHARTKGILEATEKKLEETERGAGLQQPPPA